MTPTPTGQRVYLLMVKKQNGERLIVGAFSTRTDAEAHVGRRTLDGIVLHEPFILDFTVDAEIEGTQ